MLWEICVNQDKVGKTLLTSVFFLFGPQLLRVTPLNMCHGLSQMATKPHGAAHSLLLQKTGGRIGRVKTRKFVG